ncbi:MAG: TolC family protein [Proteobacteria bacterium]|nr:TolC family protein [Pseudomonadota bacterium]MBU1057147.1 TolC family protein [Pseudomonadota bacterium]
MKKIFRVFTVTVFIAGGLSSLLYAGDNIAQKDLADNELEQEYKEFREKLLQRYEPVVKKIDQAERSYVSVFDSVEGASNLPQLTSGVENFSPWWRTEVSKQVNLGLTGMEEDVSSLFTRTIEYSSQIKVFTDLPLIRETTIQEAEGPFDVRVFADGRYADLNEPVGDDLKTGGPLRYEERSKSLEYGLKKKFITGTEVELKQRIGDMDTNSTYFNPEGQARAGTHLTIRQPLLKNFGIGYQETPIQLAQLDHSISQDELQRQVESHLLEVVRAYWGLYLERTLFLQKRRLAERTNEILTQMQGRSEVDVPPSLLARAKSLVGSHELGAMQAEYAMRNAQSRIRALVNDPAFLAENGVELVTRQLPVMQCPTNSFDNVLETALRNRPEIAQSVRHIQAAVLRESMSRNEMRPDLDFFFDTYVKGIEGDYEYGTAYSDQFDEGGPSYLVGLRFEYPLGNNGAEARNLRKRIEMRQMFHQLDVTVENVLLEVQVSHREMNKYYKSMIQSYQIMNSDKEEIKEITARIDYLLAQGDPYGDMLYRLMDASERLTKSEEVFAKSELTYNLALYNMFRATGILVSNSDVVFTREEDKETELPIIKINREVSIVE